jgi:iron complex outermembrane receptor protein
MLAATTALAATQAHASNLQLAAADGLSAEVLGQLSLEELSEISVTSVAKRPEPIAQAPSSIYVITSEDIRRSGANSLPEILRQAPNLEVNRIDALDYSITARGFSGFEAANKLLVLIDGRSAYTPLFSGVDWDQQHTLLEDIDHIEVISGPGGALWGANAVNGVVNVTTKSAFDTRGGLVALNPGTFDSDVRARFGGQLRDDLAGRVYATAFRRGSLKTAAGDSGHDGWDGLQAGFRLDYAGGRNALTLQGDAHDDILDQSLGLSGYARGHNLLGRWTRQGRGGSELQVQAYYDDSDREARLVHDSLTTWDLQAQHSFSIAGRHQIVWGGGYRILEDQFRTLFEPQLLSPPERTTQIANLFVQDETALTSNLVLTLGVKLEHNTYTRSEWMPNVRLAWRAHDGALFWAAVSRAIRNPSRIERDFTIAGLVEPGRMGSEKLIAYEAGYRGRIGSRANLSVSAFYNDYDELRTNDLAAPGRLPIHVGNTMEGETYGVEAWADFDVTPWWRLSAGGTWLGKDVRLKPGSLDMAQFEAAGLDPDAWVKLRSQMRLGRNLDLDLNLRAYDDVPTSPIADYVGADGYLEANARLAWRVAEGIELSITGQNLLHDHHPEAPERRRLEIPRSVQVGLRWAR